MKTSYFYRLQNNGISGAISIAVGRPKYIEIHHETRRLAPTWALLKGFRAGIITEKEYTIQFNAMLAGLNVDDVLAEIRQQVKSPARQSGHAEPVLMCHCSPTKFCHRHLVAEWIERSTNLVVEEFGFGVTKRSNGRLQHGRTHETKNKNKTIRR